MTPLTTRCARRNVATWRAPRSTAWERRPRARCAVRSLHLPTPRAVSPLPRAHSCTDQYCPSNVITTIFQIKDALFADLFTAIRLIGKCFGDHGFAGCFCQLALTIQPTWRRFSTNKDVRCTNGDPFVQLLSQLDSLIVKWSEAYINWPIFQINAVFNVIGLILGGLIKDPIPYMCLPTRHEPYRCRHRYGGGKMAELLSNCEDQEDLTKLCFYARVKQICGDATTSFGESDSLLADWNALFAKGYENMDSLEKEFAAAFQDSYDTVLDPLLVKLLEAVESTANDEAHQEAIEARKNICSTNAFASSMTLDMVIVSCVFAMVEKSCPSGATEPDEDFEFYIAGTSWELASIRWEWEASPPPPPPATLTLYQELMEADPRGYEIARETMDELYPDLRYVATGSVGGSVGRFPVDSKISQHQLTRAFLSSVGMEHGSFGARVVESQHTSVWRKACREMVRFLDDHPEHAAPGTEADNASPVVLKATVRALNGQLPRHWMRT